MVSTVIDQTSPNTVAIESSSSSSSLPSQEVIGIDLDNVPQEFICPVSLELMDDPLMSKDGQNYDRKSIVEWINIGNSSCPLTRKPLRLSDLVPNHKLRKEIMEWKKKTKMTAQSDGSSSSNMNMNNNTGTAKTSDKLIETYNQKIASGYMTTRFVLPFVTTVNLDDSNRRSTNRRHRTHLHYRPLLSASSNRSPNNPADRPIHASSTNFFPSATAIGSITRASTAISSTSTAAVADTAVVTDRDTDDSATIYRQDDNDDEMGDLMSLYEEVLDLLHIENDNLTRLHNSKHQQQQQ
jgi:hypothetical protein